MQSSCINTERRGMMAFACTPSFALEHVLTHAHIIVTISILLQELSPPLHSVQPSIIDMHGTTAACTPILLQHQSQQSRSVQLGHTPHASPHRAMDVTDHIAASRTPNSAAAVYSIKSNNSPNHATAGSVHANGYHETLLSYAAARRSLEPRSLNI